MNIITIKNISVIGCILFSLSLVHAAQEIYPLEARSLDVWQRLDLCINEDAYASEAAQFQRQSKELCQSLHEQLAMKLINVEHILSLVAKGQEPVVDWSYLCVVAENCHIPDSYAISQKERTGVTIDVMNESIYWGKIHRQKNTRDKFAEMTRLLNLSASRLLAYADCVRPIEHTRGIEFLKHKLKWVREEMMATDAKMPWLKPVL